MFDAQLSNSYLAKIGVPNVLKPVVDNVSVSKVRTIAAIMFGTGTATIGAGAWDLRRERTAPQPTN